MSARPLPCRAAGCDNVLGWERDGLLTPYASVRVHCDIAARRCTLLCPVCGARTDWRGRAIAVPPRKPQAA